MATMYTILLVCRYGYGGIRLNLKNVADTDRGTLVAADTERVVNGDSHKKLLEVKLVSGSSAPLRTRRNGLLPLDGRRGRVLDAARQSAKAGEFGFR